MAKSGLSLLIVLLFPIHALAGICDTAWDGDKLVESMRGSPLSRNVRLRDKDAVSAEVTLGQVQAFHDAKEKISRIAGFSPAFLICGDSNVNAFAGNGGNGQVVGVTVGMLKFVDGNPDMAAAVIGHEYAHHVKGHGAATQAREAISGLLGLIVGVALERKIQQRSAVVGLGIDLGQIGSTLVSRKFDRDQEREADQLGFEYMVRAGFNPIGSIQLANRMNQSGLGGIGLFFDSHPGWAERESDFRTMIASSPSAQRLAAGIQTVAPPSRPEPAESSGPISLAPTYTTTDAQKSFTAGITAYRNGDIVSAVREIRSAAEAGYAPAQTAVATMYRNGQGGLPRDHAEAVRLIRLAADQGYAQAQANLGAAYFIGMGGLSKDHAEAVRLNRLAADQGNAAGQANLGVAYFNGMGGLPKDEVEAVRLYRLSVDQGNPLGQANLGYLYETGKGGLSKDEVEACRLYRLSAERGNSRSQNNLGACYESGRGGVPMNIEEAVSLYRKAAAQGNDLAIANLKRLGRM